MAPAMRGKVAEWRNCVTLSEGDSAAARFWQRHFDDLHLSWQVRGGGHLTQKKKWPAQVANDFLDCASSDWTDAINGKLDNDQGRVVTSFSTSRFYHGLSISNRDVLACTPAMG